MCQQARDVLMLVGRSCCSRKAGTVRVGPSVWGTDYKKKTYTYIILKQKRRFYTNKINNTCRISLVFLHLRHVNLHHLQETSSTHVYSKTVLLQPFRLATRPNCGNTQLLYHPLDQLVGSNTISMTHSRSVIINVSGRIDLFRLISYMRHVNQFSQDIYCVDE